MEIRGNLRNLGLIRAYWSVRSHSLQKKIMRHKPQLGNPDHSRDNLHREGPENPSSLYAHLAVACWLWGAAWPSSPTGPDA